jgi:hypothetical protein
MVYSYTCMQYCKGLYHFFPFAKPFRLPRNQHPHCLEFMLDQLLASEDTLCVNLASKTEASRHTYLMNGLYKAEKRLRHETTNPNP